MCGELPCARDVASTLNCADTRDEAFSQLNDLSISNADFDTHCVTELVQTLTAYLDIQNQFHRQTIWISLQSLAEAYPDVVAEHISDVLTAVPHHDDLYLEHLGKLLEPVLEQGVDLSETVNRRYAKSLRQAESKVCRRVAVDLFRQFGTYEDFKILEEMAEYETGVRSDRAGEGLEMALDRAVSVLQKGDETAITNSDIVPIIRHVSYTYPSWLEDNVDELIDLLGKSQADIAIVALSGIAQGTGLISQTVTDRLVSAVKVDGDTILESGDRDGEELPLRRAEDALEALIEANKTEECSAYLVSKADEWLTADSVRLHEHALTQLRVLAERDPDTVQEHVEEITTIAEGGGEEGSLAGEVLSRYGQAQSDDTVSYLQQLLNAHQEGSVIGYLAKAVNCLQYRPTGETSYQSLSIDEAGDRALANVGDTVYEGQTLPIVWPAYEPRVAVLLALELALRSLDEGSDVIVFSPGGGNHWGNKGDLRDEFANYGLVVSEEFPPVPLPDIVPHARIDDGSIVPMSDGIADVRVVFSKRFAELQDLDAPDTVLLNLAARTKGTFEEGIDELLEEYEDASISPLYSNYTKHEFEERRAPRYGPPRDLDEADTLPGIDALEAATDRDHNQPEFAGNFSSWFDRATDAQDIRVVGVDDGGLLEYLEPGYEASSALREYDENRAAGRIFSRQLMFERLPVPADRYNEWVRCQRDGYFGPRTLNALIDKLEERADDIIGRPAIAGKLFETTDALRRAREHIGKKNPLYEELTNRLEESLADERRVAVFLPKETWRRAVQEIVTSDGVVTPSDMEDDRVVFVSPDSARDLGHRDQMFVIGPQRPQYAGFYVHPMVDETVVLTYRGKWSWMIERDASRFVESTNAAAPGLDYSPYAPPRVEVDGHAEAEPTTETEVTETGKSDTLEPGERSSVEPDRAPSGEADRKELADLFDQARPIDYQSGGLSRYDEHERSKVKIETADGQTFTRRDRVMRRRSSPSSEEDRYHWVSPHSLREGDQVAIIDKDVFERRWDEWLSDVYEEEHGETSTFEDLTIWYESLRDILSRLATSSGIEDLTHPEVGRKITSSVDKIEREPSTVWNWFESAAEADNCLGPARDPSLTIGPRRAEDIAALGESFDIEELTGENALRIEESMSRVRRTNMKQGHDFRAEVKAEMNSLEDNEIRDNAATYEVASVTEL
ncbi:hypothetical protein Halru_3015 [Halovivax ruber XH-70]|uniref:Uncharacterized protein n=1 Tax=Halovivax ruber (strain DSM 18193 / JCM 13892 / XH-70) TaxID=797302 RepID=L0IH60_HALRX|nr:hypothetical protein [Halovivax ruber]AGB17581.1 hypothetical protein Halru_3015 [Halovivax ruber XH-70]